MGLDGGQISFFAFLPQEGFGLRAREKDRSGESITKTSCCIKLCCDVPQCKARPIKPVISLPIHVYGYGQNTA